MSQQSARQTFNNLQRLYKDLLDFLKRQGSVVATIVITEDEPGLATLRCAGVRQKRVWNMEIHVAVFLCQTSGGYQVVLDKIMDEVERHASR